MTGTDVILFGLAHLFGDYVVQSDWMAQQKTLPGQRGWNAAIAHGITYGICYVVVTDDIYALLVIAGTHVLIDHYRLARYVVWAKNQWAPPGFRYPLNEPVDKMAGGYKWADWTGYERHKPEWLSGWLLFICDNSIHLAINLAAILIFGTGSIL